MKNNLLGVSAASLMLVAAAGAHAQTRHSAARTGGGAATAPAASATPLSHGPAIAGMCIYSNSRVLETSAVGKAFSARLQQLRAQAAAELSGEQTQLQTDEKVLAGKRATMTQEQFAQQAQPLAAREQALQQKAELRSRELQSTYTHQVERIGQQIEPIVRTAYEGHHCSVLLNGDGVMAANPAMDITPEVVSGLSSRMTTVTFDRENAPAQ